MHYWRAIIVFYTVEQAKFTSLISLSSRMESNPFLSLFFFLLIPSSSFLSLSMLLMDDYLKYSIYCLLYSMFNKVCICVESSIGNVVKLDHTDYINQYVLCSSTRLKIIEEKERFSKTFHFVMCK